MMFGAALPEDWGNIAFAMRTLFVLLTLEGLPEYLGEAREVTPWATWFMFSYVALASFFVLNLIIGIVVGANEEAHERARVEEELKRGVAKKSLADEVASIQRSLADLQTRISAFEEQEKRAKPGGG
jgi:voltage-gated sodium channel